MTLEELRRYKPQILALAEKVGVSDIRVFGSTVRGDATEESDVDLLVKLRPGVGLDFVGFVLDVQDMLGRKVDVITEKGLKNPYLIKSIMEDVVPL